jgi:dTDP-4-dehydrorhamnose reductase
MISVHDFAIKTAQVFELDLSLISPIKSEVLNQPGRRPVSTGFILDKAIDDLDYSPHNLDDGLQVVRNLLAEYSV